MVGPNIAVKGYRIRLPSGKNIVIPAELDPNSQETKNYVGAIIARDYPEDALKLGIKNTPVQGWLNQTIAQLDTGIASAVGATEGLVDLITGDDPTSDDWGGRKAAREKRLRYTPQALGQEAFGELTPGTVFRTVTESAPSTIAAVGAGIAATIGSGGAGVPAELAALTGLLTASGVEAAQGAGEAYASTGEQIKAQRADKNSPIRQSDKFKRILQEELAATGDVATAENNTWNRLAKEQAQLAAGIAIPSNLIPALASGAVGSKIVGPAVNKVFAKPMQQAAKSGLGTFLGEQVARPAVRPIATTLGKAAALAPVEAAEEAFQSAGEQAGQNLAMGQVDPRVGLGDRVGEAALRGGLAGAMGGAMFGGAAGAVDVAAEGGNQRRIEGLKERDAINQQKRAELSTNPMETLRNATNAAWQARQNMGTKFDQEDAAKQAEINRRRAVRDGTAPAPPGTLRLAVDKTVKGPETFDVPESEDVSHIEDVRTKLTLDKKATVKTGKNKASPAIEVFNRVFPVSGAVKTARANYNNARAQYNRDDAAYKALPDSRRSNYKRHMADSRKQLADAAAKLREVTAKSKAGVQKSTEQWNELAKENKLPMVGKFEAAPEFKGVSKDEIAALFSAPETTVRTREEIDDEISQLEQRAQQLKAEQDDATDADSYSELGEEHDSVLQQIAQAKAEQASLPPLSEAPPAPPAVSEAPQVEQQGSGVASSVKVPIKPQDLPVGRTDVQTPEPAQQAREVKLSDDKVIEVAPVTTSGRISTIDRESARPSKGTNVPATPIGYRVFETTRGLHGTNTGKPISRLFDTKEEAEDFAANRYDRANTNLSEEAYARKAERDTARLKEAEDRKRDREASQTAAAMSAFKAHLRNHAQKARTILDEALKEVGLSGKGIVPAIMDDVPEIIRQYNIINGLNPKTGLDKITLADHILGKFITHGPSASPLAIIAINKNLIHSGMTHDQMVKAIKDVFGHEMTHALVRGGLITPEEYSMLLRLVRKRVMPGEKGKAGGKVTYLDYARAQYNNLSQMQQEEEAIAELFRLEGMGVSRGAIGSQARGVIDFVVRLIKGIFTAFKNKDFQNFVTFAQEVKDGTVAKRIKGSIGFDPSSPVDPLGRNLGSPHADMRLSIPFGNQETSDAAIAKVEEFVAENGRLPTSLSFSPVFGGVYLARPIQGKITTATDDEVVELIPHATDYDRTSMTDFKGGTVAVRNFIVPEEKILRVGDLFDLSNLRAANPNVIDKVSAFPIVDITGIEEFRSAAAFARNTPKVMWLVNGKQTDVVMINPRIINTLSSMKNVERKIAAALSHEIDHAIKDNVDLLAPAGSTTNFNLHNPAPAGSRPQAGSRLEESLSHGATLIANKVNAEMMGMIKAMKDGRIPNSQPMQEIFETAKQASEDIPQRLWGAVFDSIKPSSMDIANVTEKSERDPLIDERMELLFRIAKDQEENINNSLQKVYDTLVEKYPDQANFIAYTLNTQALTKSFETLRHIKDANAENLGELTGAPHSVIAHTMSDVFFAEAAAILDRYQYSSTEGEQMAFWAQGEIPGTGKGQVGVEIPAPATMARPNKGPEAFTEGDVERSFPEIGLNDSYRDKLRKNVGIITPPVPELGKTSTTESDMSAMDKLRGLNMGDVNTLFEIMSENETAGPEELTRMLNERKQSDRRPYREAEVRGIINRLSSVDPKLARSQLNLNAMLKWEQRWGTGRLKNVIEDAQAGMGDAAIARRHGLARSTMRSALDEIGVTPTVGTTDSDMSARKHFVTEGLKRDMMNPALSLSEVAKRHGFASDKHLNQFVIDEKIARVNRNSNRPSIELRKSTREDAFAYFNENSDNHKKPISQIAADLGLTAQRADAIRNEWRRSQVGTTESDMASGAVYRYKPMEVSEEVWERAENLPTSEGGLTKTEFKIFEVVHNSGKPNGLTLNEISDTVSRRRPANKPLSPESAAVFIVSIKRKGFPFPTPESGIQDKTRQLFDEYQKLGDNKFGKVVELVERIYADEIENRREGETRQEAIQRLTSSARALISRRGLSRRKPVGTTESDMTIPYAWNTETSEEKFIEASSKLSPMEFEVYKYVYSNPGATTTDIVDAINDERPDATFSAETFKVLAHRIRKKGFKFEASTVENPKSIKVKELYAKGVKPIDIARQLYADTIANRPDGMTEKAALEKAAKAVSSLISQSKPVEERSPAHRNAALRRYQKTSTTESNMSTEDDDGKIINLEKVRNDRHYKNLIETVDNAAITLADKKRRFFGLSPDSVPNGKEIGEKAFVALRRESPFLWKRLNDQGENTAANLGNQLSNAFFRGAAHFDNNLANSEANYRGYSEREADPIRKKRMSDIADFFKWAREKYSAVKTHDSDMSIGGGKHFREVIRNHRQGILENVERFALNQEADAILDQMTSLHRVFGNTMGDPENFIYDHINNAEGLERILHRYREAGGSFDFSSNPVFQDEKSKGRTTPEVESTTKEVVEPILEHIKTLNITDEAIEEIGKESDTAARWFAAQKENGVNDNNYRAAGIYLLAKHAPEREAFIKSKRKQGAELRNGEGNLGVGIQLDEAAKIVEFFHRRAGEEKMSQLSALVKNATNRITNIRKDGGLIPRDIENLFNFYVPARGFAERDGENDLRHITVSAGSRGRVPLRQDPTTRGRLSLPDDPITSIAQMLQVAIMRKNINSTLNSLRRLIENNDGLFERGGKFVAGVHYEKPAVDLNGPNGIYYLRGRVMHNADGGMEPSNAKEADLFYIELSPEFVNISRYFMPNMFEKQQWEKLLSATKIVEPAMNFLRDMRTAKNPAFLPVNLVRDIGTGLFNIEMYIPNSQGKFLSRAPTAASQILKDTLAGTFNTKYGKLAKEYLEEGGSQKLHVVDDYDQLSKKLTDRIKAINSGEASLQDKTKGVVKSIFDVIDKANNAAELVSRVTAYSIAKDFYLEQGMSEGEAKTRAMYIGRNLTVNFNKHGNLGKGINNLYMFWNASVGGTAQIFRAFESNPKVRAQIMAIAALGFAMPFILKALMGDEYDKIPDWVKDRNLIIPLIGTGEYVKIPLPYGYSFPYSMGMTGADAWDKSNNPLYGPGGAAQYMTIRTIDQFMNNFAPTGSSADVLTLMSPTLLDPVLELASNKDWTGRPIMPEPGMKDYDRESQRYWSNTSPLFVGVANALSAMTGGEGRMNGLIEISPNALEYTSEFVFGGLGKLINQSVSFATGNADAINDVPFVRSFAGSATDEVSVASDYAQIQNRVKRVEKSIDDAKKARNYDRVAKLEREHAFEIDLINVFKTAERKISKAQSARRGIESKYRESDRQMDENDRQRIEEIREAIRQAKTDAVSEVAARR